MLKKFAKRSLLQAYRSLLATPGGFCLYNACYESNLMPAGLLNRLVAANRHVSPDQLGSRNYMLRLIGSGCKLTLPPISSLSQWQFAQSYRWATPFYSSVIRQLLTQLPAGLWIDIGANQGLRCLDAHAAGWTVWAYEPNNEAIAYYEAILRDHPWLRHSGDRLVVAAVGNGETQLSLDVDASSYLSAVSSLRKPVGFQLARTETVPCYRLDAELIRHGRSASGAVAKIDVEGFECEVLEGCGTALAELAALLVEVTAQTVSAVEQRLRAAGFELRFIDENQRRLTPLESLPASGTYDLLAIRPETVLPWLA